MATSAKSSQADLTETDTERLNLVVSGLNVGSWDWDIVSDTVIWSPALFRQLGYETNEIEPNSSTLKSHVHPEDLELLAHTIRGHLDQNEACAVNCRFRDKEGRYRWFRIGGQAKWDEAGKPVRFVGWMQDITGSQGEDKFRSLVEATLDWVWEMNLEGRHTYSNHRIEGILGYGVEEFFQLNIFDLFHPEDRKEIEQRFPNLVSAKNGWTNWIVRVRAKDGTYRYLESSAVPILDLSGEVAGFRGIDRDVTERRLEQHELSDRLRFEMLVSELSTTFLDVPSEMVEGELDRTLARLADFFDLDQCVVVCLSTDRSEMVFGRVFEKENRVKSSLSIATMRFPWTAGLVDAGHVVRISSIEDLPGVAEQEKEYMQAAGIKAYLTIPMVLTGQVIGRLVVSDCRSTRDWSASEVKRLRFVGELLATSIIRKRQEAELEKIRSTLMASVESSSAGIVIADAPDGKIQIVNRAALVVSDDTPETVSGTLIEEYTKRWRIFHPNGEPYAAEDLPLSRAILNGETSQNIAGIMEMPDGERRWVLANAAPVRDASGEVIAGVVVFMDITEMKQAAVEREALIQELEDKNAELERFTYTVSHDLKSPVITIKGFLGLLRKELQSGDMDKIESRIEKICAASDQMSRLLNELLELSRIGRVENSREQVLVSEIAHQAANLVGSAIEDRQVTVDIDPDMPSIYVDRMRMVEVFQNLLDNAVKFSGHAAEPYVQVGMQERDGQEVYFVADNGAGIDLAYQENVFGLFEQLEPKLGGTGIGLAIVKRIIEVHGGKVWIESEGLGSGTKVCFTIPSSQQSE